MDEIDLWVRPEWLGYLLKHFSSATHVVAPGEVPFSQTLEAQACFKERHPQNALNVCDADVLVFLACRLLGVVMLTVHFKYPHLLDEEPGAGDLKTTAPPRQGEYVRLYTLLARWPLRFCPLTITPSCLIASTCLFKRVILIAKVVVL